MTDYDSLIENALSNNKGDNKDKSKEKRSPFDYEKKEIYGKIDISKNWEIQVTKTSWNNRKPKYEIRKWKKDGRPGKGVTCNEDQFKKLIKILKNMNL